MPSSPWPNASSCSSLPMPSIPNWPSIDRFNRLLKMTNQARIMSFRRRIQCQRTLKHLHPCGTSRTLYEVHNSWFPHLLTLDFPMMLLCDLPMIVVEIKLIMSDRVSVKCSRRQTVTEIGGHDAQLFPPTNASFMQVSSWTNAAGQRGCRIYISLGLKWNSFPSTSHYTSKIDISDEAPHTSR